MSHSPRNATIVAIALLASCATVGGQEIEARPDPLIVQLNERAVRGGTDLAESIQAFARIGEWKLVDRWLTPVAGINDDAALAQMAKRIGPAILLRISSRKDLSQQSIATARKLGTAARKQLEASDRMTAAVSNLGGSTDQRLAAMRVLLSGGDAAVAALVEAAISPNPKAPRDEMLRVLVSLGSGGRLAFHQLALYGKPKTRVPALESLVRLDPKGSTSALLTALHAADATAPETEFAKSKLQRLVGSIPDQREAIAVLFADLKVKRDFARRSENDTQTITVWSVNKNRDGVRHQRTRRILAAYRDAADAGTRLRRIGQLPAKVLDMTLAADISHRVVIDPDWGDAAQIKAIRTTYGSATSGSGLSSAITAAIDNKDYAAAVGLMRMIDGSASDAEKNILLSGESPRPTPLVQATSHSEPRIRYEAASAITRLALNVPYAGSTNVKRCLSEMKSLRHRPVALLVENRADVIVQQEKILGNLGFNVRVVGSVIALEREVARGSEIELIVSKTQLPDMPAVELIDRVRRMPRGRYLPIVFFGETADDVNVERWDAVTRLIQQPATPAVFADIIMGIDRIPRAQPDENENPPLAILVESRDEVIDRQELILEELGYTTTVVKSLDSLKQEFAPKGEISLIVSAVQLRDLRPEELVNLVRRHPQGKGILIAFYRESFLGYDAEGWDPYSRRVNYPNTGAAYSNILLDISQTKRLPPLTGLDRQLYRNVASQAFAKSPAGG